MFKEINLDTSQAISRGLEEKVDVVSMLDQIIEEGDENNAELAMRITHIQVSPRTASPTQSAPASWRTKHPPQSSRAQRA